MICHADNYQSAWKKKKRISPPECEEKEVKLGLSRVELVVCALAVCHSEPPCGIVRKENGDSNGVKKVNVMCDEEEN